jgi:hypothetical protein
VRCPCPFNEGFTRFQRASHYSSSCCRQHAIPVIPLDCCRRSNAATPLRRCSRARARTAWSFSFAPIAAERCTRSCAAASGPPRWRAPRASTRSTSTWMLSGERGAAGGVVCGQGTRCHHNTRRT